MKRSPIKTIIGIFILALFIPVSSCTASNSLEFEEGMKYSYSYEMPLDSYLSTNTDIFVTVSNEDFWEGIIVVSIDLENDKNDSTRVYRFKISKDTYAFYETDYLRQKTIDSDDVEFNKLTSEGSQTGLSSYLVFLLHQNLYDLDMDSLISDGSLENIMFGGAITNLTLEGPVEYNNYNCYKIPVFESMTSIGLSSTIYISTAFPYLLIEWETKTGNEIYTKYEFEGIEQGTFSFNDYDIDEAPNNSPRAIMNYTISDLTVDFNASESYDPDGSIISYDWDFGDGTNATGISVQHTYSKSKRYTVKLYVTDDEVEKGSDMEFIDIGEGDTGDTEKDNQDDSTKTPGFELIFVIIVIALILICKRNK